ncbi:hypothetical protein Pla110_43890 [Polystyrenella longa]|uniref:Uncharacterized protein n=1 Tax=Polystyrenella longa TaxID=2528007 RepID=A0A518CTV3_9PLAN|nr:hypothetical protein [Polystyrenella longa]QDU82628.1 hypothetical protein Pla110_43890 [Polystyrenella longa]
MQLKVQPDGTIHTLYQDDIDLSSLGQTEIKRGSHVEPNEDAHWVADLAPVQGPELGPFLNRADALNAEHRWLETFWLPAVIRI